MWYQQALVISTILAFAHSEAKTGSCPPTLPVEVCSHTCGPDKPCTNATQLCCPTVCQGSMCVDAMTQRNFVNLVKEGRCPQYPRGAWVCTDMCTGDADCPRALKCCPNRCGALACQKPDTDDTIARPTN